MPFSPNDSVDILIRARTQGTEELKALGGASTATDTEIKRLQATILGLDASNKALIGSIGTLNTTLTVTGAAAASTAQNVKVLGGSARDAAAELRFLGGAMPIRSAAQFVASIQILQPLLQAAFPVVGAIALISILDKVPGAINKGVLALEGWSDKSKDAFEKGMQDVDKWADHFLAVNKVIREAGLIGLSGSDRSAAQIANTDAEIAEKTAERDRLTASIIKNYNISHAYDSVNPIAKMMGVDVQTKDGTTISAVAAKKATLQMEDDKKQREKLSLDLDMLKRGTSVTEVNQLLADRQAEADKKLKETTDKIKEANKIAASDMLQASEKGMNPAEKFAANMNASAQKMLGLNPNMDLTEWRAAVRRGLNELSMVVVEEYQKEQQKIDAVIYGETFTPKEQTHHLMMMWGITEAGQKDAMKYFTDKEAMDNEQRSNSTLRYNMDRRYNVRLAGVSGGPENQMSNYLASQSQNKLEAYQQLLQSLASAKGKDDQALQEKKATDLYARETAQIEQDTALKVAEIKKQSREEDRKVLGELFDAMDSGSRGAVGKLFKSKLVGMERTMFTNAMESPFNAISSGVKNFLTPYELNSSGGANIFGKILQGTPFGINQASPEIQARQKNTDAIENLTKAILGKGDGTSSGSGGAGLGGIMDLPLMRTLPSVASMLPMVGGQASTLLNSIGRIFGGSASNRTASDSNGGFTVDDQGMIVVTPGGGKPEMSAVARGAQIGAAAAAGAMAMYAGIRQGGAQGTATAVSGGLGAASAIPGPQQPFVAAASAIAGMVASFMGMSVQDRLKQMNNNVLGAYDRLPNSMQEQFDISGAQSDITGPGSARAVGVTVNVHAFDAKSIVDHWEPIAKAIQYAVNQNHPVRDAIRQAR